MATDRYTRWRLVLGKAAQDELSEWAERDQLLDAEQTNLDDSGFSVGVGARVGLSERRRFSPFVDASWRTTFLSKTVFEGGQEIGTSSRPVSIFPISLGLRISL